MAVSERRMLLIFFSPFSLPLHLLHIHSCMTVSSALMRPTVGLETLLEISLWTGQAAYYYKVRKICSPPTWSVNKRLSSPSAFWSGKLEIFQSIVVYNQQTYMNNIKAVSSLNTSSAFKHVDFCLLTFSWKVNWERFVKQGVFFFRALCEEQKLFASIVVCKMMFYPVLLNIRYLSVF